MPYTDAYTYDVFLKINNSKVTFSNILVCTDGLISASTVMGIDADIPIGYALTFQTMI